MLNVHKVNVRHQSDAYFTEDIMRNVRALVCFPLVILAHTIGACSSDPAAGEQPSPEVTDAPFALEGEVGPEGGSLVGAAGSVFVGVKLEVPPGALAQKTKLRLLPSLDATPLPELAVRVGAEVVLEGDVTFQKPVRLTVPVARDFESSTREDGGKGLKVWMRDGEGYRLIEPIATTAGSVTVETLTLRSAAAGLKLQIPTTKGCGPAGCVNLVACTDTSGMCLGEPVDLPFSTFGGGAIGMFRPHAYADGAGEAITFHTGASNGTVGKLSLPTNRATFSTQILPSTAFFNETGLLALNLASGKIVNDVAGDASTVLLGRFAMPTGGAATPQTSGPQAQPIVAQPARAAVTLGDGRTVVLLKGTGGSPFPVGSMVLRAPGGQVSAPIALAGPGRQLLGVVADPTRADAFWMLSQVQEGQAVLPRIDRFDASGNVLVSPSLPNDLARRFIVQVGANGEDAVDVVTTTGLVATNAGLFLGFGDIGGSGTSLTAPALLRVAPDGSFDTRVVVSGGLASVRELDADREGNLWMRIGSPDGSTGLLFVGNGGNDRPGFVPLDPALFVHEIFPSADRGVWIEVRALTSPPNTPRPLRLIKVRPSAP